MQLYQKIIIRILLCFAIVIVSISLLAYKFYNDAIHTFENISDKSNYDATIFNKKPFSVLLLGIDTGSLGRFEKGRSDAIMIVTVNPKKRKSTITSLGRDILTRIVHYNNYDTFDKLNHAYAFGSTESTVQSVEKLLDIPINHYVTINMKGLSDLVDALQGINVENKIDFTLENVHLPKGRITLNGKTALTYVRMRKQDQQGDIGRQRRQREVIQKIINKVLSFQGVLNYKKILDAIESNSQTDLKWDDILNIYKNYRQSFEHVDTYQLQGKPTSINGIYYQILGIYEVLKIQNKIKNQLEIPTRDTLKIDEEYQYSLNGLIGNQFYDDTINN